MAKTRALVNPARMSSMMAAIGLGVTLADAERRGLVRGTVERETWHKLKDEIDAIHAAGGEVEIPIDILG